MTARLENAILWQGRKTGNWICEIYDQFGFKSIGLGRTKTEATQRACKIAGWDIKSSLLRPEQVSHQNCSHIGA